MPTLRGILIIFRVFSGGEIMQSNNHIYDAEISRDRYWAKEDDATNLHWSLIFIIPLMIIIPIGGALLYVLGSIKLAQTPFQSIAYPFCAAFSNLLGTGFFTYSILKSFKNRTERHLTAEDNKYIITKSQTLAFIRSNSSLLFFLILSVIPAGSFFLNFYLTTDDSVWYFWFGAISTLGANMFTFTFALSTTISDIFKIKNKKKIYTFEHERKDRLIAILAAVRDHVATKKNIHCPSIEPNSIRNIIEYAYANDLIDKIEKPKIQTLLINKISWYLSLCTATVVAFSLLGFFYGNESGFNQAAELTTHFSWLGKESIKYSLCAAMDLTILLFLAKFGFNFGMVFFKPRPWIMHLYPFSAILCIALAFIGGSYAFATHVFLINSIPEGYHILGFIPVSASLKSWCTICAYIGIPILSTYINSVVLLTILESLTARKSNTRFFKSIDRAIAFIHQMDIEEFEKEFPS